MSTQPLAQPVLPYPLATKSQEVIPHEVAAPAGCYRIPIAASGVFVLSETLDAPILAISAEVPVLAVFSTDFTLDALARTELIGGGLFCAPGTTVCYRPARQPLHLVNESEQDTIVYVQLLNSWNILGTDQQITRL